MSEPITGPNGKKYRSMAELAKDYKIDRRTLQSRLKNGISLENALSDKNKNIRIITDPNGVEYPSFAAMCRAHGIEKSTAESRLRKGYDLKDALDPKWSPKSVCDHLGNEYKSFAEMCRRYGKASVTVKQRLSKGVDLETALTKENVQCDPPDGFIEDHLGNKFKTFAEMCRKYGQYAESVRVRLKKGMDLKSALEKQSSRHGYVDHLGHKFPSFADMCRHYGISETTMSARLRRGMPLEKALTLKSKRTPRVYYDHKNNKYPSFSAMCKAYNISRSTVAARMNTMKWPLEKALTTPINAETYEDHLGNAYDSFKAMCRAYNADPNYVRRQLEKGCGLGDALTNMKNNNIIIENDAFEHSFPSFRAMQNYYMLGPKQLRKNKDLSLENICESLKNRGTTINGRFLNITDVITPYIRIEIDDVEYIVHIEKLLDMYHASSEFDPQIGLKHLKARIDDIKPIKFPYYDITIDGTQRKISYWDLMQEELTYVKARNARTYA